ncbi:hypothetical protein [Streptomyces sp. NPDC057302]|uniref:hypothetical protein n=1 Tax=Streptomyces sp. NPDC057302 TaxID=3346094 RepID=UPI0036331464
MTEDQPWLPERPTQGHATASQAVPPRPQVPPIAAAEQWAAGFHQTHHREPTMSEYQAAVHAGLIAPERRPSRTLEPRSSSATALPPPRGAPRARCSEHLASGTGQAEGAGHLHPSRRGVPGFLAIISLFMPVASDMGFSVNYFSDEAGGEGGFLLFIMLVTIAASVVAVIRKAHWSRITAAVVGIVAGSGAMGSASGTRYASVGAGVVLLALLSVVMLAAAVCILLSPRQTPAIPPAQPLQS